MQTLQLKQSGDYVTAREWNDLVLFIQRYTSVSDGFNNGYSTAINEKGQSEETFAARWIGTGDLLPWSIVQIQKEPATPIGFVEPLYQKVLEYDDADVYFTNGDVKVIAGGTFSATKVGVYHTRVRYDNTNIPKVGQACGPNSGTGLVSAAGKGLLCLSKPDPSGKYIYVVATNAKSNAIRYGKLDDDVLQGVVTSVSLVDESLVDTGINIDNVINNTGLTLLQDSYVYIFEQTDWGATADYSMFPARLEACETPVQAAGTPYDLQWNDAGFLAGGGATWNDPDFTIPGSLALIGSQSISTTSNGNLSLLPDGTGKIVLGASGTPTSLVTMFGNSSSGGDFQIGYNWGDAYDRAGIILSRPDDTNGQVRLVCNGMSYGDTRFGLTENNCAALYTDFGGGTAFNHFVIGTTTSVPLVFGTTNEERMRIVSDGDLLIGNTADYGYKLAVYPSDIYSALFSVNPNLESP